MTAASLAPSDLGAMLRVERESEGEFGVTLASYFGAAQQFDLLARAVLAASHTSGRIPLVHVQASYLRPAPCSVPLRLSVESVDDGPSHALRRVRVFGAALFAEVTASFSTGGPGPDYGPAFPEKVPSADELPSTLEVAKREGWEPYAAGPLEFRRVNAIWPPPPEERLSPHREWLLPRTPLPPDPHLHAAAFAFASQFYAQWEFEWRLGPDFARERFSIVDHSLWLHEPARWDDWLLLDASCEVSRNGRALGHRRLFSRTGRLLATAQHTASV